VHNDYVSGAQEVQAATGANIAAPAEGRYSFSHLALKEGDEIAVGDARLVALETPGHTPEHLAYLAYESDGGAPVAAFTGGSLMVGGAGRTDLLGMDRAEELTRLQFASLRRLAALPPDVEVLPTHGAGSFCGAGPAPASRTSTIGAELSSNDALRQTDGDEFVHRQLSGLLDYPRYYRRMAELNRSGPRLLADLEPTRPISPDELAALLDDPGVVIVDARPRLEFAAAHIPGSLNIDREDDFASYVGWLIPFNAALALVLPHPGALDEAVTSLVRIGYERVLGWLSGGVEAWRASGRDVRSYPTGGIDDLCVAYRSGEHPQVVDVRQRVEWDRGHITGSRHVFVGDLPDRMDEVPTGDQVWTICATGFRAAIATSVMDAAGVPVRLVAKGGVEDWLRTCLEAPP
jgi:rhodanese-related sulfurtransferase/glyoxylase-like metal-dependent hydrolase (beta-lactamase superfamily II)